MNWSGIERDPIHTEYTARPVLSDSDIAELLSAGCTGDSTCIEYPECGCTLFIECTLCATYGPPNSDGFHITGQGRSAVLCEALR